MKWQEELKDTSRVARAKYASMTKMSSNVDRQMRALQPAHPWEAVMACARQVIEACGFDSGKRHRWSGWDGEVGRGKDNAGRAPVQSEEPISSSTENSICPSYVCHPHDPSLMGSSSGALWFESACSRVRFPPFKSQHQSQLCDLRQIALTSLCLSLFICKIEIIQVTSSWGLRVHVHCTKNST